MMRTAVLSSLSKMYHNEPRRMQASELTQMVSRVGRRGLDRHGVIVVLQGPSTSREDVAELGRLPELRFFSRFQPNYGTVLNSLRVMRVDAARAFLLRTYGDFAVRMAEGGAAPLPGGSSGRRPPLLPGTFEDFSRSKAPAAASAAGLHSPRELRALKLAAAAAEVFFNCPYLLLPVFFSVDGGRLSITI